VLVLSKKAASADQKLQISLSVNMSNDLLVLKDGQPVAFERSPRADLKANTVVITVSIGNDPGTGTVWAVTQLRED